MSEEISQSQEATIPLANAIAMAANWRTYLAAADPEFVGRSFLIPIASIKHLVDHNEDAESVRAYIGLEDATDLSSAKLIMVAIVDGNEVHTLPGGASNVVDLAIVCPPHCPVGGGPTLENS
ncbi:hypothetical protein A0256_20500 [Mucilaginibacter sp. PAMC 26640]|nr:hypothetical protein A0256_20500 [Mucilaginibacter sp. PAMC 26640]